MGIINIKQNALYPTHIPYAVFRYVGIRGLGPISSPVKEFA